MLQTRMHYESVFPILKETDAVCFTSNGIVKRNGELVMGAGCAKIIRDRFGCARFFGNQVSRYGNHVFALQPKKDLRPFYILSFPTKHHFRDPSDPELIRQSAREAVETADRLHLKRVFLTRPGCGCGGLNWVDVEQILAPVLDDRFLII